MNFQDMEKELERIRVHNKKYQKWRIRKIRKVYFIYKLKKVFKNIF